MTKDEIKDERKNADGDPKVKAKIRAKMQEILVNNIRSNVKKSTVVITNPTHFSVALKYNPDTMMTPILLEKGVDHAALKIREIAKFHEIEMVESPPLARAIYHTTELEEEVPQGLYVAVAQVLAYVFQLREYRKGRGERPLYPRNVKLPPDMQY